MEIAGLAVAWRDRGVAGFDIAGAEAGFPPTRHLDAFEYLQRENTHFTIHAGEAFGLPSIWEAIQWCGADRLGHGVRIIDDITVADDGSVELGRLAAYVRDKRIPLEMCPPSNVQTGAAASIAEHPIGLLTAAALPGHGQHRQPADEPDLDDRRDVGLVEAFGYTLDDLRWFTINAMKSAFLPFDERLAIIDGVIKPGYADARRRNALLWGLPARCDASSVLITARYMGGWAQTGGRTTSHGPGHPVASGPETSSSARSRRVRPRAGS